MKIIIRLKCLLGIYEGIPISKLRPNKALNPTAYHLSFLRECHKAKSPFGWVRTEMSDTSRYNASFSRQASNTTPAIIIHVAAREVA